MSGGFSPSDVDDDLPELPQAYVEQLQRAGIELPPGYRVPAPPVVEEQPVAPPPARTMPRRRPMTEAEKKIRMASYWQEVLNTPIFDDLNDAYASAIQQEISAFAERRLASLLGEPDPQETRLTQEDVRALKMLAQRLTSPDDETPSEEAVTPPPAQPAPSVEPTPPPSRPAAPAPHAATVPPPAPPLPPVPPAGPQVVSRPTPGMRAAMRQATRTPTAPAQPEHLPAPAAFHPAPAHLHPSGQVDPRRTAQQPPAPAPASEPTKRRRRAQATVTPVAPLVAALPTPQPIPIPMGGSFTAITAMRAAEEWAQHGGRARGVMGETRVGSQGDAYVSVGGSGLDALGGR